MGMVAHSPQIDQIVGRTALGKGMVGQVSEMADQAVGTTGQAGMGDQVAGKTNRDVRKAGPAVVMAGQMVGKTDWVLKMVGQTARRTDQFAECDGHSAEWVFGVV